MNNVLRNNLNLLGVLDALLTERNVTRAAEKMHLSQPAMSNALAKLRQLFDDPLLVRVPGGLALTPRAEELIEPVHRILEEVDHAFQPQQSFDPATAQNSFNIAATDSLELTFLPQLCHRLCKAAPGVKLTVMPRTSAKVPHAQLLSGEIDLAIGHFADMPETLHVRTLYQEKLVLVVRDRHPTIRRKPTLAQFLSVPHVLIYPQADEFLALVGQKYPDAIAQLNIAVRLPHFAAAPIIVSQSDCTVILPSRLAECFAALLPLKIFPAPFDLPAFSIGTAWHERTHHDPAQRWLRQMFSDICTQAITPKNPPVETLAANLG
jgi:DNA-binding transcriptional LysR family regulator